MPKKTITPQKYQEIKEAYQDAIKDRNNEIRRLYYEEKMSKSDIAKLYNNLDLGLVGKIIAGKR